MSRIYFQLIGLVILTMFIIPAIATGEESPCISCHKKVTPSIVKDFMSGAMGKSGIDCSG